MGMVKEQTSWGDYAAGYSTRGRPAAGWTASSGSIATTSPQSRPTPGAEVTPDVSMPLHILLIAQIGLTIGEIFDREDLLPIARTTACTTSSSPRRRCLSRGPAARLSTRWPSSDDRDRYYDRGRPPVSTAYIVNAIYRAKDGEQEQLAQTLRAMTPHARNEPGCVRYDVHRGVDDDRLFLLYEQYRSIDDFEAHKESEPFYELIRHGAWPCLESREATFWQPMES